MAKPDSRTKPKKKKKRGRSRSSSGPKAAEVPRGVRGRVQALVLGTPGCIVHDAAGTPYSVTSAVPGDGVEIAPSASRGDVPTPASVLRVVHESPSRVTAPCALLSRCGACTIQSMAYQAQLDAKGRALRSVLGHLITDETVISEVKGIASPMGYRTRLMMHAEPTSSGGLELGFFERGSTALVETSGCPVQHPLTLATLAMVTQTLRASPIRATSLRARSHRGWLHGLAIRVDPPSGRSEVTLIGRTPKLPAPEVADSIAALPGVHGVHVNVQPERSSYLMGEEFRHVAGARRMVFNLAGEAFHLSPGAFFQTSHEGAELLAKTVLDALPEKIETLADLYGGVGVFARLAASRCKRGVVAESNPHAIEDLKAWLRHSGDRSIIAVKGRVEEVIEDVLKRSNVDVALLDPPRKGCHPRVIAQIKRSRPATVVYVACGIESLVQDGAALEAGGYRLSQLHAVDMFPHTTHLEVVARFDRSP